MLQTTLMLAVRVIRRLGNLIGIQRTVSADSLRPDRLARWTNLRFRWTLEKGWQLHEERV
jgi:hypothetical protein